MSTIQIRVSDKEKAVLQAIAKLKGVSLSAVCRSPAYANCPKTAQEFSNRRLAITSKKRKHSKEVRGVE